MRVKRQVHFETKEEIRKYLMTNTNENENNITESMEYGKSVPEGKFIAIKAYLKK